MEAGHLWAECIRHLGGVVQVIERERGVLASLFKPQGGLSPSSGESLPPMASLPHMRGVIMLHPACGGGMGHQTLHVWRIDARSQLVTN